ncbi:alpha/beta hydrolase [Streptomyces sp. NPDC050788]|uniref:alpha/beta fold hydrolase n=1 Tax=Streptomyces sp. NPDC050788 TaxID=3155041 RepID=UPI003446ECEB
MEQGAGALGGACLGGGGRGFREEAAPGAGSAQGAEAPGLTEGAAQVVGGVAVAGPGFEIGVPQPGQHLGAVALDGVSGGHHEAAEGVRDVGVAPVEEGEPARGRHGPEMAPLRDLYTAVTPDGADHWPVVLRKMAAMFAVEPTLTTAELSRITAPTLVVAGDDDMMTLEHTVDLYRAVPDAQLAVVPGTSHAVPLEKPELLNTLILDFLTKDAAPTMFPVRRGRADAP